MDKLLLYDGQFLKFVEATDLLYFISLVLSLVLNVLRCLHFFLKAYAADPLCKIEKSDMVSDLPHVCRENNLSFRSPRSGQNKYWPFNCTCPES